MWIEPSPISDSKLEAAKSLLASLLLHPNSANQIAGRIDIESLLEGLDVPTVQEAVESDINAGN